mgnify:CR=1 FL=1
MVKPRQRKYPTVKSSLNIVRESLFIAISCAFWIYCVVVMIVYIGTLLNTQVESVKTIRIALHLENIESNNLYEIIGLL